MSAMMSFNPTFRHELPRETRRRLRPSNGPTTVGTRASRSTTMLALAAGGRQTRQRSVNV